MKKNEGVKKYRKYKNERKKQLNMKIKIIEKQEKKKRKMNARKKQGKQVNRRKKGAKVNEEKCNKKARKIWKNM